MVEPSTSKPKRSRTMPALARWERLRDLSAAVVAVLVMIGGYWVVRTYAVADDAESEPAAEAPPETEPEEVDPLTQSKRFEPTGLPEDFEFVGSTPGTVVGEAGVEYTLIYGELADQGDRYERLLRIDLAPSADFVPADFDAFQLPFRILDDVDGVQVGLLKSADQPWDRVTWVDENSRRILVRARGLSEDQLLSLVTGVEVIVTPTAEGGTSDRASLALAERFGLEPLYADARDTEEVLVVTDTYAVPTESEEAVSISVYEPEHPVHPMLTAHDPRVRFEDVGGRTAAVQDEFIRWVHRDGLGILIAASGRSRGELVSLARSVRELSVDELNRRRPPVIDLSDVSEPTPGPAPEFEASGLGQELSIDSPVGDSRPPVNGQVAGAIVGVGRLDGTDLDIYWWRRRDGAYDECVGVVGTGVSGVLCALDEDILGVTPLGSLPINVGPGAGGRMHLWKVPGETAVVSVTIGGTDFRQRPREGVAAFVSGTDEIVTLRAYDATGSRVR